MSTVVYQGLQSQLMDSRTLKLKLASQKPNFCPSFELDLKPRILDSSSDSSFKLVKEKHFEDVFQYASTNNLSSSIIPNLGGWTFLQALPNSAISSQQTPKEIKENSYVHPLAKTSPTSFGFNSLELCTENLGSETGTELVEDDVIFSFTSSDNGNVKSSSLCSRRIQSSWEGKKKIKTFPPPLTTMNGTDCLRVRPHREDGRLVIKAVKTPIKSSCFQAERSHGRLRLRFVDNNNSNGGAELDTTTTSDENDGYEQNVVAKSEDRHRGNGNKLTNDDQIITNEEEYQDEAEKEEEDNNNEDALCKVNEEEYQDEAEKEKQDNNNEDALCKVKDMDGNKLDDSVAKMGMTGKLQRQSSSSTSRITCMCKEGGNRNKDGSLNLEACWLATSS